MSKSKYEASMVMDMLSEFARYDPQPGKFICTKTGKGRSIPIGGELGHISKTVGYKYIAIAGTRYSCHALAWAWMTGEWNKNQIDHINGNPIDNCWANLREVTAQQNQFNRKKHIGGVGWHKASNKWRAYLNINGQSKHLGLFNSREKAQEVHDIAYETRKRQLGL